MAKRMVVFGYSITLGCWDSEGGWVIRLKKYLDKQSLASGLESFWLVYNLGISAETSDKLLLRLEEEAKRRLVRSSDIIILAPGVNDSKFLIDKNRTATSPTKFKRHVKKLINISLKISNNILFVEPTPVDESRTNPWKPNEAFLNDNIHSYNKILKSVCKQEKIDLVETYKTFINKENFEKLLEDGLHPNNSGHKIIFENVKEFLENKKYI